jgi:Family of unknown function (DUF6152)
MYKRSFLGVAAAVLLSAAPAVAHHAFSADFDSKRPITLDGTITRVEWTNPHAYVYLDVKDTNGKTANWRVEFGSPDELAGWTTPPLKVGQQISIGGWQAKNGSKFANAGSLTLATGEKLSGASSYYVNYTDRPDSLARNTGEVRGVGTGGVADSSELPGTASPLMFIGLLGTLSALGSVAVNRARR